MFERSGEFEETYFEATLATQPTNTHYIEIKYYEGTDTPESTTDDAGIGIEVTIYDGIEKQRQLGYTASSYSEITLRHNRTLKEKLLAKLVRRPPTSLEQFLQYILDDAFATTRMRLPTSIINEIVEETITELEVNGAFQNVDIDIWEDYNINSHDESEDAFS